MVLSSYFYSIHTIDHTQLVGYTGLQWTCLICAFEAQEPHTASEFWMCIMSKENLLVILQADHKKWLEPKAYLTQMASKEDVKQAQNTLTMSTTGSTQQLAPGQIGQNYHESFYISIMTCSTKLTQKSKYICTVCKCYSYLYVTLHTCTRTYTHIHTHTHTALHAHTELVFAFLNITRYPSQ